MTAPNWSIPTPTGLSYVAPVGSLWITPPTVLNAPPPVKLPIAGPAPFNTLAVVTTCFSVATGNYPSPDILNLTGPIATGLQFTDWGPRTDAQKRTQHSTAVAIYYAENTYTPGFFTADAGINTLQAFNSTEPDGFVSPEGRWGFTVHTAAKVASEGSGRVGTFGISQSWVLCWEPDNEPDARPTHESGDEDVDRRLRKTFPWLRDRLPTVPRDRLPDDLRRRLPNDVIKIRRRP